MKRICFLTVGIVVCYTIGAFGLEGVLIESFPPAREQKSKESSDQKPATPDTDDPYHFDEPLLFRESYSNLIQVKAGSFKPQSVTLQNRSYRFAYPADTLRTFFIEGSWEKKLFSLLGKESLNIHAGYALVIARARAQTSLQQRELKNLLHIMPVGLSLTYAADLWEKQWLIPTASIGGSYFFYVQFGDTTGAYADGATLNPHWSLGLRFPLHHLIGALLTTQPVNPYFLEMQYRQILASKSSVDFSQDIYLAGLAIGI